MSCESCTMCCKVMSIPEIPSPCNVWCPHVKKGKGCGIYADRPQSCRDFECVWLQSQSRPDQKMPQELRPDRTKCVMATDDSGKRIIVYYDHGTPNAWRNEPMYSTLRKLAERKLDVFVIHPSRRHATAILLRDGLIAETERPVTVEGIGKLMIGEME